MPQQELSLWVCCFNWKALQRVSKLAQLVAVTSISKKFNHSSPLKALQVCQGQFLNRHDREEPINAHYYKQARGLKL